MVSKELGIQQIQVDKTELRLRTIWAKYSKEEQEAAIKSHIHVFPYEPARGALEKKGTPVWCLIGYMHASGGEIRRSLEDWDISLEEFEAGVLYYFKNKRVIDAKLVLAAA